MLRLYMPTVALMFLALPVRSLHSQDPSPQPAVFYACYVPGSGTVYRIKEESTKRQECVSEKHVQFSWTDGAGALRSGTTASGDLAGTYPGPTVAKIQGQAVSQTIPVAGQVLTFNGSAWVAAAPTAPTTLQSPDGRFSISITNSGIVLSGPGASVKVNSLSAELNSVSASVVVASNGAHITGPVVRLGCVTGGDPQPVARKDDLVTGSTGVLADPGFYELSFGKVSSGSTTVLAC